MLRVLTAIGVLSAVWCAPLAPVVKYNLTAAEVLTELKTQLPAMKVLTFVGNTVSGYENSTFVHETMSNVLDINSVTPDKYVISAGAWSKGIGQVYKLAQAQNFTTIGIVSMRAVNETDPGATDWAEGIDFVYCVRDETWGGYMGYPLNQQLTPTSRAVVDSSHMMVGIGGGKVAVAELTEAVDAGKEVQFYPADQSHDYVKAHSEAPYHFEGASEDLPVCNDPPHSLEDRCLVCGGTGKQSKKCSPNFFRIAQEPYLAVRYEQPHNAANDVVKVAAFALEGTIIETDKDDFTKFKFAKGIVAQLKNLTDDGYTLMFFDQFDAASETVTYKTTTAAPVVATTTTAATAATKAGTTTPGAAGTTATKAVATTPAATTAATTSGSKTVTPVKTPKPTPIATPTVTFPAAATTGTTVSVNCGKLPKCTKKGHCLHGNCVNGCCECPPGTDGCPCAMDPKTMQKDFCATAHSYCGPSQRCVPGGISVTIAQTTEIPTGTNPNTGCKGCPCLAGACAANLVCDGNICQEMQTTLAPPPPTCALGTRGCQCYGNPAKGQFCLHGLQCYNDVCQDAATTVGGCITGNLGCQCAPPNDSCLNGAVCDQSICVAPGSTFGTRTTRATPPPFTPLRRKRAVEETQYANLPYGEFNNTYIKMVEAKIDLIEQRLNKHMKNPVFLYGAIDLGTASRKGNSEFAFPAGGLYNVMKQYIINGNGAMQNVTFDDENSIYVSTAGGRENDTSCMGRLFAHSAGLKFMTPKSLMDDSEPAPPAVDACVMPNPPTTTGPDSPSMTTISGSGPASGPIASGGSPDDTLMYILGACGGVALLLCIVGLIWFFIQKRNAQKNRYTLLLADEDDLGP